MTAEDGHSGPEGHRRHEGIAARDGSVARDGRAGVRVEYVRRRRVVRIRWWHDDGREAMPTEVGIGDFCERLAIDPADLQAPSLYLVFGGSVATAGGGVADLVGAFRVQERARQAFDERLDGRGPHSWAELVAIDVRGQARRLAWFGLDGARLAKVPRVTGPSGEAGVVRRPVRSRFERLSRRRVG